MTPPTLRFVSLADTLSFQLRRTAAILKSELEADLEPLGLRTSEATVLIYLSENPGRTQSETGRDLRIKSANMVPTVARLTAAGLLARVPRSGRAIGLNLTEAGRERLAQVQAVLQRQEDGLAGRLSADDRRGMVAALKRIMPRGCPEAPE